MWIRGTVDNTPVKESLKTRSWDKAEAEKKRRENSDDPTAPKETPISVADAVEQFLTGSSDRGCGEETLHKLKNTFKNDLPKIERKMSPSLLHFATNKGVKTLRQIDLKFLREWADEPLSKSKKQERVRSFFRFCVASKWITDNPAGDGRVRGAAATGLSPVIVKKKPTLYFAKEEFDALLEACSRFLDEYGKLGQGGAIRLRTLMLLMRYSGHVLAYRYDVDDPSVGSGDHGSDPEHVFSFQLFWLSCIG